MNTDMVMQGYTLATDFVYGAGSVYCGLGTYACMTAERFFIGNLSQDMSWVVSAGMQTFDELGKFTMINETSGVGRLFGGATGGPGAAIMVSLSNSSLTSRRFTFASTTSFVRSGARFPSND